MKKIDRKVILIVEDNFLSGYLLGKYISGANHGVVWAQNGREAVEICRTNPEVSMVLMDITLPVMDGIEATQKIKEIRKDLPVVIHTPYSHLCKSGMESGCDEFLNKTMDKEIILYLIQKYLN
ncbi:MAG: response regulator [Bacteroidota bacterium]